MDPSKQHQEVPCDGSISPTQRNITMNNVRSAVEPRTVASLQISNDSCIQSLNTPYTAVQYNSGQNGTVNRVNSFESTCSSEIQKENVHEMSANNVRSCIHQSRTPPIKNDLSSILGQTSAIEDTKDVSRLDGSEDDAIMVHKPEDKPENGYNSNLNGNKHLKDHTLTANVVRIKELKMAGDQIMPGDQKKAGRSSVPDILKNLCLPTQGSWDTNEQTSNTCTVDLLTVVFIQLMMLPGLMSYFISSVAPVFNTLLPRLFRLFRQKKFDDLRVAWAKQLPGREDDYNFFGEDRDIICPPFNRIGCFILNTEKEVLIFQTVIDIYAIQNPEIPLNSSVLEHRVNFAFKPSTGRVYAEPQQTDLNEPPPMIILDNRNAQVTNFDVDDLSGTIIIGPYSYLVGGFSSLYKEHYTATIFLVDSRFFTYDNECNGLSEVENVCGELSLIFLFRTQ